jgi:hypothetical protein
MESAVTQRHALDVSVRSRLHGQEREDSVLEGRSLACLRGLWRTV